MKLQRIQYDDYEEFVPIVDGIGGVLPESPEMLATYRRKMPMMIGTTRDESSLKICSFLSILQSAQSSIFGPHSVNFQFRGISAGLSFWTCPENSITYVQWWSLAIQIILIAWKLMPSSLTTCLFSSTTKHIWQLFPNWKIWPFQLSLMEKSLTLYYILSSPIVKQGLHDKKIGISIGSRKM